MLNFIKTINLQNVFNVSKFQNPVNTQFHLMCNVETDINKRQPTVINYISCVCSNPIS